MFWSILHEIAFMKTQIRPLKQFLLLLLLAFCFNPTHAQDKEASLKTALTEKRFVFNAQTVFPGSGTLRQLNGERYEVRVSGDSLLSYLPYFGRVYTAPLNNEGGIKFTSTRYGYSVKDKKKGGWSISIKPKDVTDVREFLLTVSRNGFATLQALSNNRQTITFNGEVEVLK